MDIFKLDKCNRETDVWLLIRLEEADSRFEMSASVPARNGSNRVTFIHHNLNAKSNGNVFSGRMQRENTSNREFAEIK